MNGVSQVIPISRIRVNGRIRQPDPEKVKEIAASIALVGLINPLSVSSDSYLLAGGHRLAALKLLGGGRCDLALSNHSRAAID